MNSTTHVIAGAKGASRLVHDDFDRATLLRLLVAASRGRLLAYCIMDTHLHVVLDAGPEAARGAAAIALRAYARAFNARHARSGPLLRGPIEALRLTDVPALARAIRYVHDNPVRTKEPIVAEDFHFEWSSARAFGGLARTGVPDVRRVRGLLGEQAGRALPRRASLTDLEPAAVPGASPALIVSAAAQTFGVLAHELQGSGLGRPVVAARSVAVALGRLESYLDRQIGAALGRSRSQTSRLGRQEIDFEAARIARTLLRVPALRSRLRAARMPLSGASGGLDRGQRAPMHAPGASEVSLTGV